jgi:DnaJ-class molecular chaperone
MTDEQWEAQNGSLSPQEARAQGLCWHCSGKGANYSAFGGERITAPCPECRGTGKARP